MTLSEFLSRIKLDKLNPYEINPISFDLQEVLQQKLYIKTRSGAQKTGITVEKINRHDNSLCLCLLNLI